MYAGSPPLEPWETDDWQWFHEHRQVITEADWLSCPNPGSLVDYANQQGTATQRKFFLAGAACVRRLWHLLEVPESRVAVQAAEDYAEGHITADQLYKASAAAQVYDRWPASDPRFWAALVASRLRHDIRQNHGDAEETLSALSDAPKVFGEDEAKVHAEKRAIAHLYRCVLGNPFRAAIFIPGWRTNTSIALAHQMYESRDFSAMPILADALRDAGCTSDDILNHCR
ncbi:hypothetical protein R5W23_003918 [Gemmata sp. JC673]|uniref:Uncharacterized protein n=1 Tax=Gemmata algarum TaxID=2975278 RepID=A0ABU5F6Q0_9BACT|nr:hypothetical protein [Gemmata algarum]MDY3562452.1 hypothetical protein [Gemmata algarum]